MKNNVLLSLLAVHILFALIIMRFPALTALTTLHALLTLAIGLFLALTTRDIKKVVLVSAYISGSEIMWRMLKVPLFWEFGKYAVIGVLGIALLKQRRWKNAFLPISYFALLTISIPLTISWFGFNEAARQAVSFNLSGPLSLAVCVLFFLQVDLNSQDLQLIAWATVLPIASILSIAVYSTITAKIIVFVGASNFTTSGGFGPNQVSAILGLGAVMMFLIINFTENKLNRLIAIILFIAFLTQAFLTFSRGGIYNAIICVLLAILQLSLSGKIRMSFFFISLMLFSFLYFIVIPRLGEFTGGQFAQRFSSTDTTDRANIASGELKIWFDNFVYGVGPGVATYEIIKYTGKFAGAHTEYTRMLAEHGIFGLFSLLLLIIMAVRAYFKTSKGLPKVWVVVLLVWPLVEMSHAAMRIAVISFMFGLAMVNWENVESVPQLVKNRAARR